MKHKFKKTTSWLLTLAMTFTMLPTGTLTAFAAEDTGLCEHHAEHTAECGYVAAAVEVPCGHKHTAECYTLGVLPDADSGDIYNLSADTNALACQHVHDDACGYAAKVDGSDCMFNCEVCSAEPENLAVLTIAAWNWNDENDILSEDGTYATLPNAADWETLKSVLPASVIATVDSTEVEIPVTWQCDTFPAEGEGQGTYALTAILPEGYALGEGVAAMTLEVNLGVAQDLSEVTGSCGTSANYTLTEGGVLTIIGSGAINKEAFSNDKFTDYAKIKQVIVGEGITSIGELAFRGCSSLTSVTLPTTVTAINKNAFYECSALTSVNLPEGLTTINYQVFCGCSSLQSIIIPSTVTSIGENAFRRCTNLKIINFPEGLTTIGQNAFFECKNLSSITLPSSLKYINTGAFQSCTALHTVILPEGLKTIGEYAFHSTAITNITIPSTVTKITEYAFWAASSLTNVTIKSNSTTLGTKAFFVSSSGNITFTVPCDFDETKLTSAVNNANYTVNKTLHIDANNNGTCDAENCNVVTVASVSLNKTSFTLTSVGATETLTATITPDTVSADVTWRSSNTAVATVSNGTVTAVGNGTATITAEAEGKTATCAVTVNLPQNPVTGVTLSQTSLTLSVNDTYVLEAVIAPENADIKTVTWYSNADGVATVDSYGLVKAVVAGSATITVTTQDGSKTATCTVTVIENHEHTWDAYTGTCGNCSQTHFTHESYSWTSENKCSVCGVRGGYCGYSTNNTSLEYILTSQDQGSAYTLTIYGNGAMDEYLDYTDDDNPPWYDLRTQITTVDIRNGVKDIGWGAFKNHTALQSVTIPTSVTSIKRAAFLGATSLTSISIPDNVTTIGQAAFKESGLTSISIPSGVTTIQGAAFEGCGELANVTIPESVTVIEDSAFQKCDQLTQITLPNGLAKVGQWAFNQTGLTSVTIPASVTELGMHAFSGCLNLKTVSISGTNLTIAERAFQGDNALETLTISNTGNVSIGDYAFMLEVEEDEGGNVEIGGGTIEGWEPGDSEGQNIQTFSSTGSGDIEYYSSESETAVGNLDKLYSITLPTGVTYTTDYATSFKNRVQSISVEETAQVVVGATTALTPAFTANTAFDRTITWTSSDESVATVDANNGTITGVSAGTATITATSKYKFNNEFRSDSCAVTAVVHGHSWTYSGSGATITATCGNGGCPTPTMTLTISKPEHETYDDGKNAAATLSAAAIGDLTISADNIQYQQKTDETTWSEATTTAPTNAGTYKASITIDTNKTAEVEYTIAKATPSKPNAPTMASRTDTSITLTTQAGCVYSKDGTNWQDSPAFTGLTANTEYTFCVKLTETDNYNASVASDEAKISTDMAYIASVSPVLDQPVKNGTPDTTVEAENGANYSVSVDAEWEGSPTKFLGGTVYKAGFTLAPADNYKFTDATMVTVTNAAEVTKTLNSDGSLTITATFSATAAAVPASIAIKTAPTDLEYTYGEAIAPAGLVITVTYDDGTTGDVTYSESNKDTFTFGTLSAGDTAVSVTYEGKTASIDGITVAKQPITAPANAGSKQFTGSTLTADVNVTDKPYTVTTNAGGINVGEYDVVLTLSDPSNYKWSDSEVADKTISFSITPASALTLNGTATMVKNHANYTVEIDLTTISGYPANPGGTPVFDLTSDNSYNGLTSVSLVGSKLTLVANQTSNDTADTVTVNVTGMGNYADTTTITITVSYTDKTVAAITGVSAAEGLVYSGAAQAGYTGAPTSAYTGDYVFSYSGTDKAGNPYGPTAEAPVNAGDYALTISVPESSTAYSGSTTVNFSIAPKALTITAENKSAYRGSAAPTNTYAVVGLIGTDTLTTEPTLTCAADMSANGTYAIVPSGADAGSNYTIEYVDGTLTVSTRPSSGGGSTTITTEKNEDGSTTTTTTNKITGTVTETTKYPDGSTTTVETKKDGTTTETSKTSDGTTGTVVTDKDGSVTEVSAKVPSGAANKVEEKNEPITLPVEVSAADSSEDAVEIKVDVPTGGATVEIPVDNVTSGTVVVIVNADGTEEIVKTSTVSESGVVVTLNQDATIKIIDNSKYFEDVHPVDHWAEEAVDFVVAREIYSGTSATTFHPDNPMTRGMLAVVLHRYEDSPEHDFDGSFLDVAEGSWYEDSIHWAADAGIVAGYGNGNYGPDDNITREQLAVMLWRYAGSPEADHDLSHFVDADKISGYAREALEWANKNGIISGKGGGILDPQGNATRAQVAQMLKNFIANIVK